MPQANTIDLEVFEASKSNLDLITDRRAGDYYYPPPSSSSKRRDWSRERTYSAPTRPLFHGGGTRHQSGKRNEDDDADSDPVERMRKNLERSTFLLSSLKVSLGRKPEEIQVLPPPPGSSSSVSSTSSSTDGRCGLASPDSVARHHSEPQKHSSSYYESHPHPAPPPSTSYPRKPSHTHDQPVPQDRTQAPSNPKSKPPRSRLVAPGMDRSDSNATAFSIAVSTYSRGDAQQEDHGSEFHQLMNHGWLHNPSRGGMHSVLRRQAVVSSALALPSSSSSGRHRPKDTRERDVGSEREKEKTGGRERKQSQSNRNPTPTTYPTPTPPSPQPHPTVSRQDHDREHQRRRREIFEPTPKIVSRPFPPEYLPYPSPPPNLPPPPKRGHGRSVSVAHAPLPRDPQSAMGSGRKRVPDVGMRRVRFDF